MVLPLSDYLKKIRRQEEEAEAQKLAAAVGLRYANLDLFPIQTEALTLVAEAEARKLEFAPVRHEGHELTVAAFNPHSPQLLSQIQEWKKKKYHVVTLIVSRSSLEKVFHEYARLSGPRPKIVKAIEINQGVFHTLENFLEEPKDVWEQVRLVEKQNPFLLTELLIAAALKFDASDIHFEPAKELVRIRLRIDGLLVDAGEVYYRTYPIVQNRLKLVAGMILNITNQPQDGRFTLDIKGQQVEVRMSAIPEAYGESLVLRVLNPKRIQLKLEELGLRPDSLAIVKKEICRPNGLLLNTGPTGSGKTTTLYTILSSLNKSDVKIITIEDPIEYHLKGVEQTQVNPRSDYTFSNGLRAILRQDPDIILVGEIRDKDTAAAAIHAALTGHLVISTLHTNDSLGAIPRLIDLGVEEELIGPALNLVVAQRLVRRVCLACAKKIPPPREVSAKIGSRLSTLPPKVLAGVPFGAFTILQPQGCKDCFSTGYRGQIGIFELLVVTPTLLAALKRQGEPGAPEPWRVAVQEGLITLQQDGLIKVIQHVTSVEEVERVTGAL